MLATCDGSSNNVHAYIPVENRRISQDDPRHLLFVENVEKDCDSDHGNVVKEVGLGLTFLIDFTTTRNAPQSVKRAQIVYDPIFQSTAFAHRAVYDNRIRGKLFSLSPPVNLCSPCVHLVFTLRLPFVHLVFTGCSPGVDLAFTSFSLSIPLEVRLPALVIRVESLLQAKHSMQLDEQWES